MRVVHTAMRVRDIEASLRFYEALGFERRGKLQFEGAYNIYLGVPGDGDTLELTVNEGHDEPYDLGTGYGHIALTVGDLDAVVAKLAEQGIEPEKPPFHPGRPRRRRPDLLLRRSGRLPHRAHRRRRVPDPAGLRPPRAVSAFSGRQEPCAPNPHQAST
jgi:lactoylglutathione lyase